GLLDFDEKWLFTKTVQITTGSDGQIITNTVRVTANDDDPPNPTLPNFEAEAKDDATVTLRFTKPKAVTNSSLCQFHTDSSLDGHQFNQIFIQESGSSFRLNATNPGQFYDNVLYAGNPGDNVTLTLKIPYPFVTQGANPVHIYSDVSIPVTPSGLCFIPLGSELSGFTVKVVAVSTEII